MGLYLVATLANPRGRAGRYLKHVSAIFVKLHAILYPNRAISPTNGDILERAYPYFRSVWSGDRAEGWYLVWLAIHPDHQYKGIGRRLVQWGLDRAEEEHVWASVVSAPRKEEFYRDKCGFDEEYGSASMGEGNPLASWGSGRMFWRRPKKVN
jgi:GNAT superfamily N-acetyltransferase